MTHSMSALCCATTDSISPYIRYPASHSRVAPHYDLLHGWYGLLWLCKHPSAPMTPASEKSVNGGKPTSLAGISQ